MSTALCVKMNRRARGSGSRAKDRRASARGRQGKTPGEVPGAFHSPRRLQKHPRAAKPPEVLPLPRRGRPLTSAPGSAPGRSRDRGWGASTSRAGVPGRRAGWGARSASAAGSPRLLPFLEGRGRRGRGGRRPARPRLPAPPAAPGAGRPRLRQASGARSGACHFLPGGEGGGGRPGAAGPAGGGGWRGGASGAAGPLPRPSPSPPWPPPSLPRVPRFLPAPVAMTTPLPGLRALGLGVFFPPLSLFLLFFSLLSLRALLVGGREETEKVVASSGGNSPLRKGEGDGRREGSDVKKREKEGIFWSFWE